MHPKSAPWIALLALASLGSAAQAKTIIHAGTLIDGVQDQPPKEASIVVDKGRIVEVAKGYLPAGEVDTVVDLKAQTLMPRPCASATRTAPT